MAGKVARVAASRHRFCGSRFDRGRGPDSLEAEAPNALALHPRPGLADSPDVTFPAPNQSKDAKG